MDNYNSQQTAEREENVISKVIELWYSKYLNINKRLQGLQKNTGKSNYKNKYWFVTFCLYDLKDKCIKQ